MTNINVNPFERFHSDWAIVTAGTADHYNGMTVSWGSMGTIWSKPIITLYVRPDRYTWQFLRDYDTFTVSFYSGKYRDALVQMGRLSGRDCDKAACSGLTPKELAGSVTFAEAEQTFVCRKIYMNQLRRDAVPEEAKQIYQNGIEPHYLIMGEVTGMFP